MSTMLFILLLVTYFITATLSTSDESSKGYCNFTVESYNYTHAMMIAPVQHYDGFIVTLKSVDVSVEKITKGW